MRGVVTDVEQVEAVVGGEPDEADLPAVGGRLLDLKTPTTIHPDVYLPLYGAHQGDNASVALTAVETFFAAPVAHEVVLEGFAEVTPEDKFHIVERFQQQGAMAQQAGPGPAGPQGGFQQGGAVGMAPGQMQPATSPSRMRLRATS